MPCVFVVVVVAGADVLSFYLVVFCFSPVRCLLCRREARLKKLVLLSPAGIGGIPVEGSGLEVSL